MSNYFSYFPSPTDTFYQHPRNRNHYMWTIPTDESRADAYYNSVSLDKEPILWENFELQWGNGPMTINLDLDRSFPQGYDLKNDENYLTAVAMLDEDQENEIEQLKTTQLVEDACDIPHIDFVAPISTVIHLFQAMMDPVMPLDIYIHKVNQWLVLSEDNPPVRRIDAGYISNLILNTYFTNSVNNQQFPYNPDGVHRFNKTGIFSIAGQKIATGSDLVTVRKPQSSNYLAVYLQEESKSKDIHLEQCFLECMMAEIPEFAVLTHRNGVIQSSSMYKTEDHQQYVGRRSGVNFFDAIVAFGKMLQSLRRECKVEACTYTIRTHEHAPGKFGFYLSYHRNADGLAVAESLLLCETSIGKDRGNVFYGSSDVGNEPEIRMMMKDTFLTHIDDIANLPQRADSCPGRFVSKPGPYVPMERFRAQVSIFYYYRGISFCGINNATADKCFMEALRISPDGTLWKVGSLLASTILKIKEVKLPPEQLEKEMIPWRSPYTEVPCTYMYLMKRKCIMGLPEPVQWKKLLNVLPQLETNAFIPRVWWLAAAQALVLTDAEAALDCLERSKVGTCCCHPLCGNGKNNYINSICKFDHKMQSVLMAPQKIRQLCLCLTNDRQRVIARINLPSSPFNNFDIPSPRNEKKKLLKQGHGASKKNSKNKSKDNTKELTAPYPTWVKHIPLSMRGGSAHASDSGSTAATPSSTVARTPAPTVMEHQSDKSPANSIDRSMPEQVERGRTLQRDNISDTAGSTKKDCNRSRDTNKSSDVKIRPSSKDRPPEKRAEEKSDDNVRVLHDPVKEKINAGTHIQIRKLSEDAEPRSRSVCERSIPVTASDDDVTYRSDISKSRGKSLQERSNKAPENNTIAMAHRKLKKHRSKTNSKSPYRDLLPEKKYIPRTLIAIESDEIAYGPYPRRRAVAQMQRFGKRFASTNEAYLAALAREENSRTAASSSSAIVPSGSNIQRIPSEIRGDRVGQLINDLEQLELDIKNHSWLDGREKNAAQVLATIYGAMADLATHVNPCDYQKVGNLGDSALAAAGDSENLELMASLLTAAAFRLRAKPPNLEQDFSSIFETLIRRAVSVAATDETGHARRAQTYYGLALTQGEKVAKNAREKARIELNSCGILNTDTNKLLGKLCLLDAVQEKNMEIQIKLLKEAHSAGIPGDEVCKTILQLAKKSSIWLTYYRTALQQGVQYLKDRRSNR